MDLLAQVWSNFVVLERAWSNFAARSAVLLPDSDDQPALTGPRRRTRMTPQLRAEVVRRYQAGEPSRVVAEDLGIAKATVLKLLRSEGVPLKSVGARY
jgi:FixJ family two-component response regulator